MQSFATSNRISREAVFSSDARLLFIPMGNNARSYSVATGIPLLTFNGHTSSISGICLHPVYSQQIITASLDGTLRIWDTEDGNCIKIITIGTPIVRLASAPAPNQIGLNKIYITTSIFSSTTDNTLLDNNEDGDDEEDDEKKMKKNNDNDATTSKAKRNSKKRKIEEKTNNSLLTNNGNTNDQTTLPPISLYSSSSSYPLGDEPACLQVRPPSYSLIHTLNSSGKRRSVPLSTIYEVDIGTGDITQTILQRKGFVTGMEVRRLTDPVSGNSGTHSSSSSLNNHSRSNSIHSIALIISIRHSLYIYRSTTSDKNSTPYITNYKSSRLISSLTLHPIESYVSIGTLNGHIVTYFVPELTYNYAPTNITVGNDSSMDSSNTKGLSLVPIAGNSNVRRTEVHWHAHTPWATTYLPDGTYLLTGGEESTLVIWQVPPATARGSGGPSKDKRTMTFLPRLGSPIRCISSYSAASKYATFANKGPSFISPSSPSASNATSTGTPEAHGIKDIPPLLFAVTLVDNTVILFNGLNFKSLWRIAGLGIAGQAAVLPTGLVYFNDKVVLKNNEKILNAAVEQNDSQAIIRAQYPVSKLFKSIVIPSVYYTNSRYLKKGMVVDPRTKCVYLNGFPGKASLQLYDIRKDICVFEIDVGVRNLISRTDDEPSPPVRITHAAIAYDGSSLVTVEVMNHGDENSESNTLKFWTWLPHEGRYALSTRIDNVHKTEITTLEYHPTEHYVITGSRDRTFKHWQREVRTVAHASEAGKNLLSNDTGKDKVITDDTKNETNNGDNQQKLNRKEKRAIARSSTGNVPDAIPSSVVVNKEDVSYSWTCLSVGFYRDFPVTAGAFSGDGSLLALAYSHMVTLWTPMANSLKLTLVSYNTEPITNIFFIGFSEYLVCSTRNSLTVWNLLTGSIAWTYQGSIVGIAADRVGLSTSNRFAVILRSTGTDNNDVASVKHYCILFDVTTPVPLQIWELVSSTHCHAGIGIDENTDTLTADNGSSSFYSHTYALNSSSYSIVFIPASSLPIMDNRNSNGNSTNGKAKDITFNTPNGLFILGPMNESFAVSTVATVPVPNDKASVSTESPLLSTLIMASTTRTDNLVEIISNPIIPSSILSASNDNSVPLKKAVVPNGPLMVSPTVTSSTLRVTTTADTASNQISSLPYSQDNGSVPILSSTSNVINNSNVPYSGSLTSMINSFGPAAVVQQPKHIFETLLSSFLAPPVTKLESSLSKDPLLQSSNGINPSINGKGNNNNTILQDSNDWTNFFGDMIPLTSGSLTNTAAPIRSHKGGITGNIVTKNSNNKVGMLMNNPFAGSGLNLPTISSSIANLFSIPSSSNNNTAVNSNSNSNTTTTGTLPTSGGTSSNVSSSPPGARITGGMMTMIENNHRTPTENINMDTNITTETTRTANSASKMNTSLGKRTTRNTTKK